MSCAGIPDLWEVYTGQPKIDAIILRIFSNMFYNVYNHLVKFQLKTPPMHGEMKMINYVRGQFEPKSIIWRGKINQTIV